MENGEIPDGQISASSQWSEKYAAIQGRLNFKKTSSKAGCWGAKKEDHSQWLQIELGGKYSSVSRVATQGSNGYDQWVTKYKLQYSNDETSSTTESKEKLQTR